MGTNHNLAGKVNPASHYANIVIQEIYADALRGRQPAWKWQCPIMVESPGEGIGPSGGLD